MTDDSELANPSSDQRAKLERFDSLFKLALEAIDAVPSHDMHAAFLAETRRLGLPDAISPPIEIFDLRDALHAESDRGCALLAASYLEGELGKMLRGFLVDDQGAMDDLLEGSRPLGSFSAKIDLAYCLGLIPEVSRRDFHLVRRIRNEFGHKVQVTFQDQAIVNRCNELQHQFKEDGISPRRRFVRVAIGLAAVVHSGMRSNPRRLRAKDIDMSNLQRGEEFLRGVLNQLKEFRAGSSASGLPSAGPVQ